MCPLCGALLGEHWSDRGDGRRGRIARARILRRVLRGAGVTLSDWGGSAYVLHSATGAGAVVHDLSTLWAEAERLAGHPLDPLDPALIEALGHDA